MEDTLKLTSALSKCELECLAAFARDEQSFPAEDVVLAKLQQLGLLMRGWGRTFVVTRHGHLALQQRPGET